MEKKAKEIHEIQILIAEDEEDIAEITRHFLEDAGYSVDVAYNGREALEKIDSSTDLVLLDVMLPEIDGYEVCRQLRSKSETEEIPVIFLTAKSEDDDQIQGLNLGGDDYIVKPSTMEVILARVQSALRRAHVSEVKTIELLGLTLYPKQYKALINGENLHLTFTEFQLINCLVRHPSQIFTRDELLEMVWHDDALTVTNRTIDVHMKNLRDKLGDFSGYIETIWGIGYRFNGQESLSG
ncbi:MAG: response regulator transcription factor [Bacteroidetes bacterium]|nr:response regulator transcription factor [Bacteroidota bacterium]MCY4232478.1 response regulator transcription factor [Bacteroidota bacterium]